MITHRTGAKASILFSAFFLVHCGSPKPAPKSAKNRTAKSTGSKVEKGKNKPSALPKEPVVVTAYIMSKCPYGVSTVEPLAAAVEKLGPHARLDLEYIAYKRDGAWTYMHGETEHQGNIVQLCAQKLQPSSKTLFSFLRCVNATWRKIPEGWQACAEKAGLDSKAMATCTSGPEGKALAEASYEKAKAAGANGSPTLVIGGENYSGRRSPGAFLRGICNKFVGAKAPICSELPPQVEVPLVVITDKRCKKCDPTKMVASLKGRFFPKLKAKVVDYNTEEGKKLYEEYKLRFLPAYILGTEAKKAESYGSIARWLREHKGGLELRAPAKFDPKAEICDNKIDDTGNGKTDCADSECRDNLICRPAWPRKLDVFVMSQCPYGAQAILSVESVLKNAKNLIDFDVHYIVSNKPDGSFGSLHGQSEVDENIRQLCAKKIYRKKNRYLNYLICRAKNYRSESWKECAVKGISALKIEKCATGDEGKELLAKDSKLATQLNIGGSPTWMANNRYLFHGVSSEAIRKGICKYNADLAGCDKRLSDESNVKGSCGK
jgi:hypothetical protein